MKNGKDILYEVAFTTQSKIIECKWLQKVWMEQTENGTSTMKQGIPSKVEKAPFMTRQKFSLFKICTFSLYAHILHFPYHTNIQHNKQMNCLEDHILKGTITFPFISNKKLLFLFKL